MCCRRFVIAAIDYLIDLSALLLRILAKNPGSCLSRSCRVSVRGCVTASDNCVLAAIEKGGKRRINKKKQRDPRPPVHWFLQDNSRSVMSTICLSAPEHTCQLVPYTLCVFLRHNTAAVLFWLWAIKDHLGITLGITGRCLKNMYMFVTHMFHLGAKLIDGSFWTLLRTLYHKNMQHRFHHQISVFTSHLMFILFIF